MIRGLRGATTVSRNDAEEIAERTRELLQLLEDANGVRPRDIASAIFTVTSDLDAQFPAVAARGLPEWKDVPLLCANEIPVPRSLPRCIRVLIHWNTDRRQEDVRHVYPARRPPPAPGVGRRVPGDEEQEEEAIRPRLPTRRDDEGRRRRSRPDRGIRRPRPRGAAATTATSGRARKLGIAVSAPPSLWTKPSAGPTSFCSRSPTDETPALLREAAAAAPEALITDAASLKRPIAAAAAGLPASVRFVRGHPMAGSRTPGIAGARADLFQDRPWLDRADREERRPLDRRVQDLVRGIGARPTVVDAERHDALMTWVSHLPLAVASALARAVASGAGAGLDRMAGPGLLDTTRVADTPASLALELALSDPQALAAAIEAVRAELEALAGACGAEA